MNAGWRQHVLAAAVAERAGQQLSAPRVATNVRIWLGRFLPPERVRTF